jgi:hypothetical protein
VISAPTMMRASPATSTAEKSCSAYLISIKAPEHKTVRV